MSVTTTLSVKGMTCSNCSNSIVQQVTQHDAIKDAQVSLITEEAIIRHTLAITPNEIKEIIDDCGFDAEVLNSVDVSEQNTHAPVNDLYVTKIKVQGMTCSNCTNSIRSLVEPRVDNFEISLITEEAVIRHHANQISKDELVEMIEDCGFDATLIDSTSIESDPSDGICQSIFSVKGMTCGACSSSIENVMLENENVKDCKVSLVTEQAIVTHDSLLSVDEIKEIIEDCGFEVEVLEHNRIEQDKETGNTIESIKFNILNYDGSLDQISNVHIPGIVSISIVSEKLLNIMYNPQETGVRTLIKQFQEQVGISIEPQSLADSSNQQIQALQKLKEIKFWKKNFWVTAIIGFPMLLVEHFFAPLTGKEPSLHLFHGVYLNSLIELVLATYVQFTVGKFFYQNSKNSIKHGSGTMDLLIFVSTNISYYFSILTMIVSLINNNTEMSPHTLFETAIMLMNFVSLGKWMESKAKSETSTSLSRLLSMTSTECTIISHPQDFTIEKPGETMNIPNNHLQINDIVSVKPGEKIPGDGVIINGESEIDESLLTGESLPIPKRTNDKVFGGSVNGPGHLYVLIKTTSENSQLSKIIKLVKLSQLQKAPIQSYADYVASIFVPTILVLALITFICWLILCHVLKDPPAIFNNKNGKFFTCLKISISVIVVACPCALGLAAPTAIMVGTGVGASNGVLIKGGEVLEVCNDIDIFLFDKTGTLTVGQMNVHNFEFVSKKFDKDLALQLVGSLENKSEHPVGEALVSYVKQNIAFIENDCKVSNFQVLIGKGLVGDISVKGMKYSVRIGNLKVFDEDFVSNDPIFSQLKIDSDLTLAHVAINDEYIGYFELKDVVKSDSREVLNHLKSKGYEVAMVTGDSAKAANKIAKEVDIPFRNVFAEISPYGKEQLVSELQVKKGLKVAFIGDGLNDSPALAKSDLGIAIASGTDIAIEAADIVILNFSSKDRDAVGDRSKGTLQNVLNAIEISQHTLNRIKWNFFWSSVYNLTMVPIAMGVLIPWGIQLSPMFAALAMAFSSVSVVLSSLLLKRWKPRVLSSTKCLNREEDVDLEAGGSNGGKKWSIKDVLKIKKNRTPQTRDIELTTGLLTHAN